MSNIFIGLKKTCLGVLDRGERDKDNEIGLKEGGGIEMSTTVLPFAMLAPSLCTPSLLYLLTLSIVCNFIFIFASFLCCSFTSCTSAFFQIHDAGVTQRVQGMFRIF